MSVDTSNRKSLSDYDHLNEFGNSRRDKMSVRSLNLKASVLGQQVDDFGSFFGQPSDRRDSISISKDMEEVLIE